MANPTTNYGFVLPTPTDLVTDLPADFDVALQGVDTRLKALNPATTLGDLTYASSTANTNTRLGVGSTGQVLTVAGGVPSWATSASGGMTLISSTALSGTSVTLGSIPQTYQSLYVSLYGVTGATANAQITCKVNNLTTSVYLTGRYNNVNSYLDDLRIFLTVSEASLRTSPANAFTLQFDNYKSTTNFKPMQVYGGSLNASSVIETIAYAGYFRDNTAITSLVFEYGGNAFNGGTVELYGVK